MSVITLLDLAERASVLSDMLTAADNEGVVCPGAATIQYGIHLVLDTPEEVADWADFLGVEVTQRPHKNSTHHNVTTTYDGVEVSATAIVSAVAEAVSA